MANNSQVPKLVILPSPKIVRPIRRSIVIRGWCFDDGAGGYDLTRFSDPGTEYVRQFEVTISLRKNRQGIDIFENVHTNTDTLDYSGYLFGLTSV